MEKEQINHKKLSDYLSGTQIIALGFLGVILVGALLLTLPCMNNEGVWTPFVDALFMSTTSVCVTGLTLVNVGTYWNLLGHIVILILIQIGGIGVVAMSILFMMILKKKVSLKDRMLIQESYSANSLQGLVKLIRKILIGIMTVEGIGALFYSFYFVPEFGFIKGIWISVFTSVSAFCNAGIDILGGDSLTAYVGNPLINVVTVTLIVVGGIGFFVWWDVVHVIKKWRKTGIKSCFWKLNLHSKIVITATAVLIFGGAAAIFILEYTNPATLGGLSLLDKIQASFFQSVTTRTAGFYTLNQGNLRETSALLSVILMFIGGSPAGTAGGVKTMTIVLLFATTMSVVKGEKETIMFRRSIPMETVRKALAVFSISGGALVFMTVLMTMVEKAPLLTVFYEVTSALATVGLSMNFSPLLSGLGKIIIIFCMYIGRIGPISMVIAFRIRGKRKERLNYAHEDVIVG